jgi:O-antigen/teichoic acid export membrane protein
LTCLFGYLLLRFDLLMVKQLSGVAEAGYYSIATTMADYLLLLPASISTILFPKLSRTALDYDRFRLGIKATVATAGILLPIIVVAGLLASPVIRVLFGTPFLPAALAFVFLLPGVYCMGIQTVMVQFLNSQGYPKSVVFAWLIALVANIALNLLWIPRYGMKGASIASSICYFLVLCSIATISFINRRRMP